MTLVQEAVYIIAGAGTSTLVIERRLGVPLENVVVMAEPFRASSWIKPQIELRICRDIELFSATKGRESCQAALLYSRQYLL